MNNSPDMALASIKMLLSLGLVLAIVWGFYRVAKKRLPMGNTGGKGRLIQVVENHYLGVKKQITMVKVPGSILVLGVSVDKVSLLTQIEDPALLQNIEAVHTRSKPGMSFKDQLRRITQIPGHKAKFPSNETAVE